MKTVSVLSSVLLAAFLAGSAPALAQQASTKPASSAKAGTRPGALCPVPPKPAAKQDPPASSGEQPIALVDGQPLYRSDLPAATQAQLLQLHQQEYKVESQALDSLILAKVVEDRAKKQGISVDELYKKEVDAKIPEPSADEARGYYLAVKGQTTLPFEQIEPQVKQLLKNAATQQARQKYADDLRASANVAILLQPPVVDVGRNDPGRMEGDPNAPITIVEFGDFQCPFCGRVEPTLMALLKKYKGKVKLAFRDFPLSAIHPYAEIAAEASRCAEAQGKFWPMHDAIYADQSKLTESDLVATASRLGLKVDSFTACLKAGTYKAAIQQDLADGTRAGVSGTPSFYINGRFLSGALPQADFEKIIDSELIALKSQNPTTASR